MTVGDNLQSCTEQVTPIEVPSEIVQRYLPGWDKANKVVIVDTPGFDDTSKSDTVILQGIADWLADS